MRKFCTLFAALALVLLCIVLLPTQAQAAELVDSGTCGDNLTWTLDDAGTLTISGNGAIPSYYPGMYTPWMDYAESVTSIVIKDGVTTIGYGAFSGFANLTSVSIPASLTNVGIRAFANCTGLNNVFYCGTDGQWSTISFGTGNTYMTDAQRSRHNWIDATFTAPKTCVICGATEGKPKPNVSGTCGENLTWTLVEDTLTISGTGAMTNYYLSSLPWYSSRSSIKTVVIEDGVTSISSDAFYGCYNLKSVSIPDSITSVGYEAFFNCTNLTYNLYGNGKYLGNAGNPYVYLCGLQSDYCDLIIPSGVRLIDVYAFVSEDSDFGGFDYITLRSVHISNLAEWCNISFGKAEYVVIGDSIASQTAYGNPLCCTRNLYINGELVTELVIPDGVTKIKDYAFIGLEALESIHIPESVISIGQKAFSGCTGLVSVTYCGTAEQWNQISIESGNPVLKNVRYNTHAWTSASVAKQPTYVALGEQVSSCSICGAQKTETIPAKFYGTSVNLGNTLDMYFGFYTGLVDEGGKVVFVREFADGTTETTEAPITSFKKNNSVYDITYTGLAAKEMCDTIHVCVYNGEGTLVGQHSDSIRSYILRQLRDKDYGQEFRTLCIDLLNYGAAAQETFGYNTGDLANKDLTKKELAEGTQTVAKYTDKQAVTGNTAAYYGTAYLLETKISMTMAVRGSYFGNGCYALVSYTDHTGTEKNNIRLEGKKNNSVYEFILDEIVVADGRCLLTIEFYKADGTKVITVQDSMESYTARNADIYPLAEKMLAFSDSAYKYLHRNDK